MADTGIFATTAEVQRKAGAHANSTYTAEAYTNDFMTQAESLINVESGYNWSDVYTALNVDVKGILKLAASNKAAQYCIQADTSKFLTLVDASIQLAVLENDYQNAITLLKKTGDKQGFINGA